MKVIGTTCKGSFMKCPNKKRMDELSKCIAHRTTNEVII